MVREIILDHKVSSQEELASLLEERGIIVAQATLSRDIREMNILKQHDGENYYYSLTPREVPRASGSGSDSIVSIEFSGSVAVLKTRPGHANMVASIIDASHVKESAGTIAGDDTIILIIREGASHDALVTSLGSLFKGLGQKILNLAK